MNSHFSSAHRERGLSLIELIMFILIVSVALAAILQVLSLNVTHSADPQMRKQALSVAEGLMEEVQLARFTFCDPTDVQAEAATAAAVGAPGTGCLDPAHVENVGQEAVAGAIGRPFDNVNDYVAAFGTPVTFNADVAGTGFPNGYTATVSVSPGTGLGSAGSQITPVDASAANMNALLITVIVSYNNGNDSVRLDGYRTRYAPNSLP
jgi:MSHA pilin protein MshD